MKRRALESVSVFLFLTIFPDAILMSNAQVLLDYPKGSQYGEPTVFVIKRVKNQTFDERNTQRLGFWAPVGMFEPHYRTEFTILILLVLSCLILFTILGNILVVAAVFHERSLHRCSNYLIVSLAFADLMVGIMVMPISALDGVSTRWFLGVSVCNFWIVMDVLCCTASVLHLVAIAIDRYWAVTRANYSRKNNKKVIFGMIVAVWLTSVSISLPSRFTLTENIKLEEAVVSERTCIVNPNKVYTVFSTAGAFFLPITFLVCIYIKIYASARKRIRKQKFKWMKYPSGDNDRMGNFESILTIAEAETLSGLPPNPVKPLANGVSNTKQIFSVEAEYFHYSDKDAYLSSPTIWIDEGDGSDNKDNMNIDNCHANPLFPRPTDGSLIQSPFIPQSPMLPPRRAFNHIPLNSSTHPLIPQSAATPPPLPPVPNSRPPVHTSSVTSSKENGRVMTNSPVQERKHKHVLDTTITYAFMSVKKRLMNKQLSEAALETVLARRERLEHRRERRAARTLAIITGCFLLCWIPFSINALIQPFCGEACALPNSGVKFFLWLGYLNSLLNPIIYTIFSPDYRKAFAKTLTCTYCRSR